LAGNIPSSHWRSSFRPPLVKSYITREAGTIEIRIDSRITFKVEREPSAWAATQSVGTMTS
jgi:hypothetical protein